MPQKKTKPKIKITTFILNIFTIIFLNILFYVCNTYPKHILELNKTVLSTAVAILINIAFYIIFFLILTTCYYSNKTLLDVTANFRRSVSERFYIKKISVLILFKIMLDIINHSLVFLFQGKEIYIIIDILTVLEWVVIYYILKRKSKDSIYKDLKRTCILSAVIILCFAVCLAYNISDIIEFSNAFNKFEFSCPKLLQIVQNMDYSYGVRNLTFDTLLGISFYVIHITGKSSLEKTDVRESFLLPVRLMTAAMFFVLLFAGKFAVFPYNTKNITYSLADDVKTYVKKFTMTDRVTVKSRNISYGQSGVKYMATEHRINFYNSKVTAFSVPGDSKNGDLSYENGVLGLQSDSKRYNICGREVTIYADNAICFVENEKPKAILYNKIAGHSENELLTETCKQLISEGNMNVFEYAYRYLLKYDRSFIRPYIRRIAKGDFTEEELAYISDNGFRSQYYVTLASKIK